MATRKKTVYVAMSGGVDSSVAAALLKERGFNVVGVFFKPWQPLNAQRSTLDPAYYCNWREDRLDAMRVASILGIPFKTWDFSKEYGQKVARYMINSYRQGVTPNPDVMCNKEIKFGLFLKRALAEGADYIATGHYARIAVSVERIAFRARLNKISSKLYAKRYTLYAGIDKNKDQSYFLWTLTQAQLRHCLFPIGGYTKPEVRSLARKFGLPNHDKKDSQGVCFVGELDMKDFLTNYIKPRVGEIKLVTTGRTIGRHDGFYYYTIGQRHGLNIDNGGGPYYVVDKDIKRNLIYVTGDENDLAEEKTLVTKVNWIGKPALPIKAHVKIRYRTDSISAAIAANGGSQSVTVKFARPVRAITPGQSAVFYHGQEVLGGGIIGDRNGGLET